MELVSSEPFDDNYLYCDDCNVAHLGNCSVHGPLTRIVDATVASGDSAVANCGIPLGLTVRQSSVGDGLGVFTKYPVSRRVVFGPYKGKTVIVESAQDLTADHCWQIHGPRRLMHCVDGSDPAVSSWMRFVKFATNPDQQNLKAFQYKRHIFFRTIKFIPAGSELLVWFCDTYTRVLTRNVSSPDVVVEAPTSDDVKLPLTEHVHFECTVVTETAVGKLPIGCSGPSDSHTQSDDDRDSVDTKENHHCQMCGSTFRESQHLSEHLKDIHSVLFVYSCRGCSQIRVFKNFDVLKNHQAQTRHCGFNQVAIRLPDRVQDSKTTWPEVQQPSVREDEAAGLEKVDSSKTAELEESAATEILRRVKSAAEQQNRRAFTAKPRMKAIRGPITGNGVAKKDHRCRLCRFNFSSENILRAHRCRRRDIPDATNRKSNLQKSTGTLRIVGKVKTSSHIVYESQRLRTRKSNRCVHCQLQFKSSCVLQLHVESKHADAESSSTTATSDGSKKHKNRKTLIAAMKATAPLRRNKTVRPESKQADAESSLSATASDGAKIRKNRRRLLAAVKATAPSRGNKTDRLKARLGKGVRPFKCDRCSWASKHVSNLTEHLLSTHDVFFIHRCLQCFKCFDFRRQVTAHKNESHHMLSESIPIGPDDFVFEYALADALREQPVSHRSDPIDICRIDVKELLPKAERLRPHVCHVCDARFKYFSELRVHGQKKHDIRTLYTCRKCPNIFTTFFECLNHRKECNRRQASATPGIADRMSSSEDVAAKENKRDSGTRTRSKRNALSCNSDVENVFMEYEDGDMKKTVKKRNKSVDDESHLPVSMERNERLSESHLPVSTEENDRLCETLRDTNSVPAFEELQQRSSSSLKVDHDHSYVGDIAAWSVTREESSCGKGGNSTRESVCPERSCSPRTLELIDAINSVMNLGISPNSTVAQLPGSEDVAANETVSAVSGKITQSSETWRPPEPVLRPASGAAPERSPLSRNGERRFKCGVCGCASNTSGNLMEHQLCVHNIFYIHRCRECWRCFDFRLQLVAHKGETGHMMRERISVGPDDFIEEYAAAAAGQSPATGHRINAHGLLPKEERLRPFECDICQSRFRYFSQLRVHKTNRHKMKAVYVCGTCQLEFVKFSELFSHRRKLSHVGIETKFE